MLDFYLLLFFPQDDFQGAVEFGNAEEFAEYDVESGAGGDAGEHICSAQNESIGGMIYIQTFVNRPCADAHANGRRKCSVKRAAHCFDKGIAEKLLLPAIKDIKIDAVRYSRRKRQPAMLQRREHNKKRVQKNIRAKRY